MILFHRTNSFPQGTSNFSKESQMAKPYDNCHDERVEHMPVFAKWVLYYFAHLIFASCGEVSPGD